MFTNRQFNKAAHFVVPDGTYRELVGCLAANR